MCDCVQACTQDKNPDLYNFFLTLPRPTEAVISQLPKGFFYVKLENQSGINVAKLMRK